MKRKLQARDVGPSTLPRRRPASPSPQPSSGKSDRRAAPKKRRLSPQVKPEGMSLEEWQVELRRQFGRKQKFRLKNVGEHPFFSEFEVHNPLSQSTYRVHVRGPHLGDNYCTCPDFATNTLGTCKHVELTLAALERKRGGATALRDGLTPELSEVYLEYGAPKGAIPAWPGLSAHGTRPCRAPVRGWILAAGVLWPLRDVPVGDRPARARGALPRQTCWPLSPRSATPSSAGPGWPRPFPRARARPPSRAS